MSFKYSLPLIILLTLGINSCSPQDDPENASTMTQVVFQTSTPTLTSTSKPLPTSHPKTQTPTELPRIADSTQDLFLNGPWLSFWDDDLETSNLFITNPDGSGKVEFVRCESCEWPYISENSPYISFVRTNFYSIFEEGDMPIAELVIVELPSLGEVEVINLISNDTLKDIEDLGRSDLFNIARLSWLSWSPDGSKVAFVAAIDAPNLDLYTFDVNLGKITRLSSGSNHAADPFWSPDGKNVIHKEVKKYSLGYEASDLGVWIANVETGENQWLYAPNGRDELRGWVNDKYLITYAHRWPRNEGPQVDIRLTDISSGSTRLLCQDTCEPYQPIIDQRNGILVYQKVPNTEWYALSLEDGHATKLIGVEGLDPPVWSDAVQRLIFNSPDPWSEVDCNGELGHYYLDINLSLECTTIKVGAEEFHSPDGKWTLDSDVILKQDDQVVRKLLDDAWFRRESADDYPFFTVVWRADSSGALIYRWDKLFYVEIPYGDPILVHKGDNILWPTWINSFD